MKCPLVQAQAKDVGGEEPMRSVGGEGEENFGV